ncbi:MAG: lytic murein transglycosylase [Acidobacteria bacterium]|nr:lytic murein transglycosylase [Acidobacteriota bacterium]
MIRHLTLIGSLALACGTACADARFAACLAEIRAQALAAGVEARTFDAAVAELTPDESVIQAMQSQPEFKAHIWDYLAGLVDEQRVADGKARLEEWSEVLAQAEQKFGVDRYTIVAVWGVESDFGRIMGTRPLVRSLATVSCAGSRQRFFRGELVATLRILQSGDVTPEALVGSWAGAFGQTQFMPTTFQRLAVDFDGDGRRDIVGSVPDALGSTANYLRRAGWATGAPWGYEVRLPAGYAGPAGRRNKQSLAQWAALGITRLDGRPLDGPGQPGLLLPAGAKGPAFLVFRNFDAIYSYNAAESYGLAIAHLSDRLRGGGPFATPWPTDDPGLGRAERREVQQRLIELGHDLGQPDGVIGPRTQAAIRDFQSARGLPVDGRAGMRLLRALREGAAKR